MRGILVHLALMSTTPRDHSHSLAHPPAGSPAPRSAPSDVLYEGPARLSVAIGAWLQWTFVSLVGLGAAIALVIFDVYSAWPVWLLALLGVPGLLWTYLKHTTTRYKITTRRVEFERGVFSRSLDSLELWRVLDLKYGQTLLDRICGNAKITLEGTDRTHPQFVLHGLPNHRMLFDRLRDAVHQARHASRPLEFAEGSGGGLPQHDGSPLPLDGA